MADTAQARKGRRAHTDKSEDSVEADFGGDYSEDTLDLLRQLGRKDATFGEVEPSEAAAEPISQAAVDAAKAELKSFEHLLDTVKDHVPDDAERRWVDYKSALVAGASPEEIAWLKLKAYHHAMDSVRASHGLDSVGEPAGSSAPARASPLRQAAAALTQADAGRATSSAAAAADAVLRAVRDMLPSSSGEAEAEPSDDLGPLGRMRLRASQALASTSLRPPSDGVLPEAAIYDTAAPRTLYREDYLEEQRLERQLAQQGRQRSQAFTLSLAVALGVSVLRWWVQRRKARRPAPGDAGRRPGPAVQH